MNYSQAFKNYWYVVALFIVASVVLSFLGSIIQTPKYLSTVKLLVIQRQFGGYDAYSASKSAETIANTLSKMVYTTSFFEKTQKTNFAPKVDFSADAEKRKKEWQKMVVASPGSDGSLSVSVYHPNREVAESYALSVSYVLVNNGQEYHGGNEQVEIKMVDQPQSSGKPATPVLWQNMILGFMAGALLSTSLILLLGTRKINGQTPVEKNPLKKKGLAKESVSIKDLLVNKKTVNEKPVTFSVEEGKVVGFNAEEAQNKTQQKDNHYHPESVDSWMKSGKFKPKS